MTAPLVVAMDTRELYSKRFGNELILVPVSSTPLISNKNTRCESTAFWGGGGIVGFVPCQTSQINWLKRSDERVLYTGARKILHSVTHHLTRSQQLLQQQLLASAAAAAQSAAAVTLQQLSALARLLQSV